MLKIAGVQFYVAVFLEATPDACDYKRVTYVWSLTMLVVMLNHILLMVEFKASISSVEFGRSIPPKSREFSALIFLSNYNVDVISRFCNLV